jgi:adenine/guanine/hypoxanthine permease
LIPFSIQIGTAVGIGLLTALAGATEIDLVVTGHYTIVKLGKITPEVMVTIAGKLFFYNLLAPLHHFLSLSGSTLIAIALHYHIKGAFCLALCFGTIVWWTYDDSWPKSVASVPKVSLFEGFSSENYQDVILLTIDLLFLYILTLSGLVSSLSTLAGLVRSDNTTPRNRWLFIVCGLCTCLSGLLSGPPILISPESASGIKGGAKTGLSTIVCGLLFAVSVFFNPIFRHVPSAATAPLLIAVGVILFQNVQKLNWKLITDSMPAYFVLFFIPFTYSILQGVAIGYVMYLILGVFTGQIFYSALDLWIVYFGVPFKDWELKKRQSRSRGDTGATPTSPQLQRLFSADNAFVDQLHGEASSSSPRPGSPAPPPSSPAPPLDSLTNHEVMEEYAGIILNPGFHESVRFTDNLPFFPSEAGYQLYIESRERERMGSH